MISRTLPLRRSPRVVRTRAMRALDRWQDRHGEMRTLLWPFCLSCHEQRRDVERQSCNARHAEGRAQAELVMTLVATYGACRCGETRIELLTTSERADLLRRVRRLWARTAKEMRQEMSYEDRDKSRQTDNLLRERIGLQRYPEPSRRASRPGMTPEQSRRHRLLVLTGILPRPQLREVYGSLAGLHS